MRLFPLPTPNQCRWLEPRDYGGLMLATDRVYPFNTILKWEGVMHGYDPVTEKEKLMWGAGLTMKPGISAIVEELVEKWNQESCQISRFGASSTLDALLQYRQDLVNYLGVDCNYSFRNLISGLYPVDCNSATLAKLMETPIAVTPQALMTVTSNEAVTIAPNFKLFIVGKPNQY